LRIVASKVWRKWRIIPHCKESSSILKVHSVNGGELSFEVAMDFDYSLSMGSVELWYMMVGH
jgi:hypothetical protein